jgi:hypothetical protein
VELSVYWSFYPIANRFTNFTAIPLHMDLFSSLPMYGSVDLSDYGSAYQSAYLCIHRSAHLSIHLPVCLWIHLCFHSLLSIHASAQLNYLSMYLSICTCVLLSLYSLQLSIGLSVDLSVCRSSYQSINVSRVNFPSMYWSMCLPQWSSQLQMHAVP